MPSLHTLLLCQVELRGGRHFAREGEQGLTEMFGSPSIQLKTKVPN